MLSWLCGPRDSKSMTRSNSYARKPHRQQRAARQADTAEGPIRRGLQAPARTSFQLGSGGPWEDLTSRVSPGLQTPAGKSGRWSPAGQPGCAPLCQFPEPATFPQGLHHASDRSHSACVLSCAGPDIHGGRSPIYCLAGCLDRRLPPAG